MFNPRWLKGLNLEIDQEELKKVIKEDIRDLRGPKTVAVGGPRPKKNRLKKYLDEKSKPE